MIGHHAFVIVIALGASLGAAHSAAPSVPDGGPGATARRPDVAVRVADANTSARNQAEAENTTGLTSGRYVLKSWANAGILTIDVAGTRFTGSIDWGLPGERADPVVDGKLGDGTISFTRLCRVRTPCVQKFVGTASGGRAKGTWTGTGGRGAVGWSMWPR